MVLKIGKKIETYLCEFGLSRKEIKIYLALLEQGRSSVLDIAKKTGIKRSTAHNYIESLISKGIISQSKVGRRRVLVAEIPEKLKALLNQQKWKLQRLENILPEVIEGLYEAIPNAKENSEVEVKYFEGIKATQNVYSDILASKQMYSFVHLGNLRNVFPTNHNWFKQSIKKNKDLEIWEIFETTDRKIHKFIEHERYHYKFVPKNISFAKSDIMIYDDKIVLITLANTVSTILIESKSLAKTVQAIHKIVWNLLGS